MMTKKTFIALACAGSVAVGLSACDARDSYDASNVDDANKPNIIVHEVTEVREVPVETVTVVDEDMTDAPKQETDFKDAKEEVKEAKDELVEAVKATGRAIKHAFTDDMDTVDKELASLDKKMKEADDKAEANLDEAYADLQERRDVLAKQWDAVKDDSSEEGEAAKDRIEKELKQLADDIDAFAERINS